MGQSTAGVPPVLVVGIPRSGTTLLQSVLSRSQGAFTLPETHYFERVLPSMGRSCGDSLAANEVKLALAMLADLMGLHAEAEAQQALLAQADTGRLSGRGLFEFVIDRYRPAEDEERQLRPIEKTPGHVQHLGEIAEAFPSAKFVHIVREPKNAISSLLQTPFVKAQWLIWHCTRWNATTAYVERFSQRHPDSILTIRYEDLVTDSRRTVEEVCTFLQIAFSDDMLVGEQTEKERSLMLKKETWKRAATGPMMANRPDAWRERISEGDGWFIELLTRRRSALYGYEASAAPGLRAKTATWWRQWRFVGHNPQEKGVGLWLLGRCQEMGEVGPARQLAMGLVAGDVRMLRHESVRAALGRRQISGRGKGLTSQGPSQGRSS